MHAIWHISQPFLTCLPQHSLQNKPCCACCCSLVTCMSSVAECMKGWGVIANSYSADVECNPAACDWYKQVSTSVTNTKSSEPQNLVTHRVLLISKTSKHKNSNVYTKFERVVHKVASPTHSSHVLRGQEQTRIAIKRHCVHFL